MNFLSFSRLYSAFVLFILTFAAFAITPFSAVSAAPTCSTTSNGGGTATSPSSFDQGNFGGAGAASAATFLAGQGLSSPTRVDKVEGITSDCKTGENGVVLAKTNSGTKSSGTWFSDQPICAVGVHAGGGSTAFFYTYQTPVTSGTWSTAANGNKDISNLQFFACTPEETGSVTIIKKTVGGDGTFKFTGSLVTESADFGALTTADGTKTVTKTVTPGAYAITEDIAQSPDFDFTSLTCGNGGSVSDRTATITVPAGGSVTCTYTNTKKGNVTIIKNTVGGDGTFKFTGSLVTESADFGTLTTADGTKTVTKTVTPGAYAITEDIAQSPDFDFTSLTCGNGGSVSDRTATITVPAGGSVTCTYTNTKKARGALKVRKVTIGGDGQFSFSVTGQGGFSLKNGGEKVFANLVAGQYTVEETALPAGWTLQSADCGGGVKNGNAVTVNVGADQTVVCTFTNFKKKDDKTTDVTKVFINRRVDNLLSHDPDRARVLRRLDDSHEESLKDGGSYEPLKITGSADAESADMRISMSLSQLRRSARALQAKKEQEGEGFQFSEGAESYISQSMASRWDFWIEGHISSYDDSTGGINREGDFKIVYLGADYAIAPGVLIGALVQIDRTDEDIDDDDLKGTVEGTGWMAGPYVGVRLRDNLFFDARAAWGTSNNEIDLTDVDGRRTGEFDTDRWLASATLTGNYLYGPLRISPSIGVAYGNEGNDEFKNSIGQIVDGSDITIGRLTFGPEFGYRITREDGITLEPHLSLKGIWNFDQTELELSTGSVTPDEFRGQVEGGVIIRLPNGVALRAAGSYDGIGDKDLESWTAKSWINIPLN